jgi:Fe2+ transport system protein FeoA
MVRVGTSTFALRKSEASMISVDWLVYGWI